MNGIAIQVQRLGKRYSIAHVQRQHDTLREAFINGLRAPIRRFRQRDRASAAKDTFWAIRDISFEVKRGEVLGVIGPNGAGKSTLLKILSRITEPTEGRARIRGHVRSLLEVGTGFHPELTGRENIYLNGAILGMRKAEIDRRFDEIVAFAGIERFLDTPVKRYSSGMYVRLAFAVAAHLEPEILLVDEVLAVGDAAFQKKCLGKMESVAQEGRTVLFVSHNMAAINSLTQKAIYLCEGKISAYDVSSKVVQKYLDDARLSNNSKTCHLDVYRREFAADSIVRTTGIWVDTMREELPAIQMGKAFTIYVQVQVAQDVRGAHLDIALRNARDERVVLLFSRDQGYELHLGPGEHVIAARIENLALTPGSYSVDVGINQSTFSRAYDLILCYPVFRVVSHSDIVHWIDRPWGAVHCDTVTWSVSSNAIGTVDGH